MEIPPYAGSHHIFLASETFKTEEKDANHWKLNSVFPRKTSFHSFFFWHEICFPCFLIGVGKKSSIGFGVEKK